MVNRKDSFLERLFTDHGKALRRYLTRKLGNPEEAEEIAQEAMLRLHRLQDQDTLDNARPSYSRLPPTWQSINSGAGHCRLAFYRRRANELRT